MGDLRAEIVSTNKAFVEALNSGDPAAIARHYTKEAKALPPNAETVVGREAIQAMWRGAMDQGVKEANLETVEVTPMGENTAFEIGKYVLKIQPEKGVTVTDTRKYFGNMTVSLGNSIQTSGIRVSLLHEILL